MTICAAAIGPDGVWIGSDGREVWDGLITSEGMRKWNISPCREWAISHSGETAFLDVVRQIFAAGFSWPEARDEDGVREFLCRLRAQVAAVPQGPQSKRDEEDVFPTWGWAPIVATPLGIWQLDSTLWALGGPTRGAFLAIGSGRALALGAMSALYDEGCRSAERLVQAAVATACRLECGCGGEQWIHRMDAQHLVAVA